MQPGLRGKEVEVKRGGEIGERSDPGGRFGDCSQKLRSSTPANTGNAYC